jgi:hypothetical protein
VGGPKYTLFEQESFHDLAAMGRKVIPDQDDLGAFDKTLPVFQERDEALGVESYPPWFWRTGAFFGRPTGTRAPPLPTSWSNDYRGPSGSVFSLAGPKSGGPRVAG